MENPDDDTEKTFYTIGTVALCGPIFIMNLAVVVAVCSILYAPRSAHRATTMFQGNIAVADMCMLMTILFSLFYPHKHRTPFLCALELGTAVGTTLTSMSSILLIAVDRFLYIVYSIHYYRYMTEFRAQLFIGMTWFLGVTFGFVPVTLKVFFKKEQGPLCRFISKGNVDLMVIAGCLGAPLMVATFVLHMAIYRKARSLAPSNHMKLRSIIIVFLSSSSFFFTWGPFFISMTIFGSLCGENVYNERLNFCRTLESLLVSPLPVLGLTNSLLNPIIFVWWFRPFTQAIFEIFFHKFAGRKTSRIDCPVTTPTTTT